MDRVLNMYEEKIMTQSRTKVTHTYRTLHKETVKQRHLSDMKYVVASVATPCYTTIAVIIDVIIRIELISDSFHCTIEKLSKAL